MTEELSKEQVALYDRQIRLWGMAAQQKISKSNVVIMGHFTGVAQELVKNLTLKGAGSIHLVTIGKQQAATLSREGMLFSDVASGSSVLSADGDQTQLEQLVDNADQAKIIVNAARILNPIVSLEYNHFDTIDDSKETLLKASMVFLVNDAELSLAFVVDTLLYEASIPFEWILTNGFDAVFINDFAKEYRYSEERKRIGEDGQSSTETLEFTLNFASLKQLWAKHRDLLQSYVVPKRQLKSVPSPVCLKFGAIQEQIERYGTFGDHTPTVIEFPPVNSIIGALAAQEALKAITKKDLPIHNVTLFNGRNLESRVISIN